MIEGASSEVELMDTVLTVLAAGDDVTIVAIGGGIVVAIVSIIASAATRSTRMNAAERTRREIAAYVAEGTISPEQGERMMRIAGTDPKSDA